MRVTHRPPFATLNGLQDYAFELGDWGLVYDCHPHDFVRSSRSERIGGSD